MIIQGNRQELEQRAAVLLARELKRILDHRSRVIFGVVGGSSVGVTLAHLGEEKVDWNRVHLFMADERLVGIDHPDSNYRLVSSVASSYIPASNLHPFVPQPGNERGALHQYQQELADLGGRLEVLLLSSGEDGHIASLFPEHETIDSRDDNFLITHSAPKPPPQRMSASPRLISRADCALLLFLGNSKAEAFKRCVDDRLSIRQCPAKLVRTIDTHYLVRDIDGVQP